MVTNLKVLLRGSQSSCSAGPAHCLCHHCRKGPVMVLAHFRLLFLVVCFPDRNLGSLKIPLEAHVCNVLHYWFLASLCI